MTVSVTVCAPTVNTTAGVAPVAIWTEFSVHTQESHASPGRTIVAIAMRVGRDVNPRWLFVEAEDGQLHRHELPEAQGDQIQFMIPTDSALVQALREANARVTLR